MATLFALMVTLPLYFLLMRLWSSKGRGAPGIYIPSGQKPMEISTPYATYTVEFDPETDWRLIDYLNEVRYDVDRYASFLVTKEFCPRFSGGPIFGTLYPEPGHVRKPSCTEKSELEVNIFKDVFPEATAALDEMSNPGAHLKGLMYADMNRAIMAGEYKRPDNSRCKLYFETDRLLHGSRTA